MTVTVLDAMHAFIAESVGWDAGEPMKQQAGEALAAIGFEWNMSIESLVARLAVSDDDLAALERLADITFDDVWERFDTVGDLLAYLKGTQP